MASKKTSGFIKTAAIEQTPGLSGMVNPAGKSPNKVIYIVEIEDPSSKSKTQFYVCLKKSVREGEHRIEITGTSVSSAKSKTITTTEAETLLGKTQTQVNLIVPWGRVVSIRNLTFSKAQ